MTRQIDRCGVLLVLRVRDCSEPLRVSKTAKTHPDPFLLMSKLFVGMMFLDVQVE